jgi:hypothetical protein
LAGFFSLACARSGNVSVVFSGTLDSAGLENTDNSVAARKLREVVMARDTATSCAARATCATCAACVVGWDTGRTDW